MKACIYGAGAIGGWLGMALAQAGHTVSMVARGDTLRALQADGLRMRRTDGTLAQVPVTAHSDPAALGVQDLVVIAVKAPGLPDVARAIAPLLGPHTVVLTAMNGVPWWFLDGVGGAAQGRALESVDTGGVIAQAIPARSVLGGVVHASCSLEAPGFVRHHFGDRLILGEPDGSRSARQWPCQSGAVLSRRGGPGAGDYRQPGRTCGDAGTPPSASSYLKRLAVRFIHRRILPVQRARFCRGPTTARGSAAGAGPARQPVGPV